MSLEDWAKFTKSSRFQVTRITDAEGELVTFALDEQVPAEDSGAMKLVPIWASCRLGLGEPEQETRFSG